MASFTTKVAEKETEATPLVGVVTAQDAKGPRTAASGFLLSPAKKEEIDRLVGIAPPPPPAKLSFDASGFLLSLAEKEEKEEIDRRVRIAHPPPPAKLWPLHFRLLFYLLVWLSRFTEWLSSPRRLWRRYFARFDPYSIPVGQRLSEEQMEMLERHRLPGYLERLDMDREITMYCLYHYNLKHPGNEYEPAPGKVNRNPHFHNGICWTHGNFVARKKRSGWFSFLHAPRTLFFFELARTKGFNEVVTCTPLDEPVTESYSVLGFPLWFSTRRSGKLDSFCKTCYCRFDVPHPGIHKIFACGHKHVEGVCEMCYRRSHVLHPNPGGFAFGYCDPYHPYPTKH